MNRSPGRILRKLVFLASLGLSLTVLRAQPATAACDVFICMDGCDNAWFTCRENCGTCQDWSICGGQQQNCEDQCDDQENSCYTWCLDNCSS
jgi:hypothetical protein